MRLRRSTRQQPQEQQREERATGAAGAACARHAVAAVSGSISSGSCSMSAQDISFGARADSVCDEVREAALPAGDGSSSGSGGEVPEDAVVVAERAEHAKRAECAEREARSCR